MKGVLFPLFSSLLWFAFGAVAEVPECPTVTGMTLINAEDNEDIRTFTLGPLEWDDDQGLIRASFRNDNAGPSLEGIIYGFHTPCDFNFRVDINDACQESIESVFIELVKLECNDRTGTGPEVGTAHSRCENKAPYTMAGDIDGDYFALSSPPSLGCYAVYITTHSDNRCSDASIIETYRIGLSAQTTFPKSPEDRYPRFVMSPIYAFYLWDADTNERGASLGSSQELCVSNHNIEAYVPTCGVEKVVFELFIDDGDKVLDRTEVKAPYMLCGDSPSDGNIFACEDLPQDVHYALTATVFWQDGFTGPKDSLYTSFTEKCSN